LEDVAFKTEKAKTIQLKTTVDGYMEKVSGIREHCERCLRTERWGGNVVLMVVDAAFTSIGLNYFTSVVPKVEDFNKEFVESGKIKNLRELAEMDLEKLRKIWKNERSWKIAKAISFCVSRIGDDKSAFRSWARKADVELAS